jgi:hypothetical protein
LDEPVCLLDTRPAQDPHPLLLLLLLLLLKDLTQLCSLPQPKAQ